MCVFLKRTVDEAQAGPRQDVVLQVVLPVLPVPLLLDPPPALHRPAEHQVVAVAGAAQSVFGLGDTEPQRSAQRRSRRWRKKQDAKRVNGIYTVLF